MTEESFCVLVGIKKYGGLLWKRRYSSDCTQGSHHDWTHNPRPHISCSPLSFCKHLKRPKVHCHRILGVVFFSSLDCRKTICYVLADIKALFKGTRFCVKDTRLAHTHTLQNEKDRKRERGRETAVNCREEQHSEHMTQTFQWFLSESVRSFRLMSYLD